MTTADNNTAEGFITDDIADEEDSVEAGSASASEDSDDEDSDEASPPARRSHRRRGMPDFMGDSFEDGFELACRQAAGNKEGRANKLAGFYANEVRSKNKSILPVIWNAASEVVNDHTAAFMLRWQDDRGSPKDIARLCDCGKETAASVMARLALLGYVRRTEPTGKGSNSLYKFRLTKTGERRRRRRQRRGPDSVEHAPSEAMVAVKAASDLAKSGLVQRPDFYKTVADALSLQTNMPVAGFSWRPDTSELLVSYRLGGASDENRAAVKSLPDTDEE